MNRREFLANSAAGAGLLVAVPAFAQTRPCNPPSVQLDGNPPLTSACSDLAPGDIFTADYSSALGNWDNSLGSAQRTQGRIAAGGPKGLDAFEVVKSTGTTGEYYCGNQKTLPNFANGVSRFFRWFERHGSGNNYLAADGENFIHKRLLLGYGEGTDARTILNVDGIRNGQPYVRVFFDGCPCAPPTSAGFAVNQWIAMQAEVIYGSSARARVWINNDNFSNPTLTLSGYAAFERQSGFTQFGMYSNDGLAVGGVYSFRDAGFRVASTFDAGWHRWLTS
jgi:hypothetical protein